MERKKRDLEDVKSRIISRKENSPTAFHYLTSMQETLRDEIRGLEAKADVMESQIHGLQKDQVTDREQRKIEIMF